MLENDAVNIVFKDDGKSLEDIIKKILIIKTGGIYAESDGNIFKIVQG